MREKKGFGVCEREDFLAQLMKNKKFTKSKSIQSYNL